ncbi:hypothetical protein Bbelb_373480 [Branchiostoma belcheri]|nr:hypothetical protein Bbelb_373480 [Branchiostoma belcheri]
MATAEGARGLHPSMNWDEDDLIGAFQKFKQKADLCFKSFLKETTPEQKVQKSLVGKDTLTLKEAADTARAFEATSKQMSSLSSQASTNKIKVETIKRSYGSSPRQKQSYKTVPKQGDKICRYCGTHHEFNDRNKCPAYGATCNSCGKPNHWKKMCRSTNAKENITKDGVVKKGILTPSSTILTAYGGAKIPHLGKAIIEGKHNGRDVRCCFYITMSQGPAILGLKACQQMNVIKINHEVKSTQRIDSEVPIKDRPPINNKADLFAMYPDCFDDTVGCFEGEYHITVDPTAKPVVHPPRRVPLELKERLKDQLMEMQDRGIISAVTQLTDWVNSIIIKEKPNGKLRICLDPRDLNNALKRDHYPTPTLEEITPAMSGAQVFSKLDASNGYWNIKLDEESSLLTTFNSPYGRFKFNRLPFGLRVSQDVFHR